MNALDKAQDLNMAELDAIQQRARLPDVAPVTDRDCNTCGDEIPAARLAAVPHSFRCVRCQSVIEAGHGGYRHG